MIKFRHPFDSAKWGRICGFLIKEGVVEKRSIVEPLEASKNDLLVVSPLLIQVLDLFIYKGKPHLPDFFFPHLWCY